MKNRKLLSLLAAVILLLDLTRGIAVAQQFPGMGNIDPQQFQQQIQQRIMEYFRDQLKVTNDDEWGVIEGRLSKVVQVRIETLFGDIGMGGMGMGRNLGGGRGLRSFLPPDPEMDALQKAIETNEPAAQIQALLAKYREARQRKKAALAQPQEELRQVLSLRQEATLVSIGLLD